MQIVENIGRIEEATTDLSFDSPQSLLGAVHHCSNWITNIINTSNLLNVRISNRIFPHIPLNFIHTAPNSLSFTQSLFDAGRHCSHRITGMIIIAFHAVFINQVLGHISFQIVCNFIHPALSSQTRLDEATQIGPLALLIVIFATAEAIVASRTQKGKVAFNSNWVYR